MQNQRDNLVLMVLYDFILLFEEPTLSKSFELICPILVNLIQERYVESLILGVGLVSPLDNLIIQTSHQRSAPYTNLYTLTKRCYWLDSKIFSQREFRNLSTPIKQPIACIQIQTVSLVLILVYIFNCLMLKHKIIVNVGYIQNSTGNRVLTILYML